MYRPGDEIKTLRTADLFWVEKVIPGGMGVVYIALTEKDQRHYALKTSRGVLDTERLFRFRWEGLVWIILGKHRNIVQARWFDLDLTYRPFLIMEYVPGERVSLRDWLRRKGKLSLKEALGFVLQALTGLIYAQKTVNQELGLPFIHRDIKPENLLIKEGKILKITDFGLAKSFIERSIGGTYHYMPPEQWKGEEVEEKTDIYALTCTLYELLSGRPLFKGPSREQFLHQHLYELPRPLEGLPEGLESLTMISVAKDPQKRPGFRRLREELLNIYRDLFGAPPPLKDEPEPSDPEEFNSQGAGFDQLGLSEKALLCYHEAIALDPHDPRFYLNRANARLKLKDIDGAQNDYQEALRLSPGMIGALLGLGHLFILKGDKEASLRAYKQARTIAPEGPLVYMALGNFYAQEKDYHRAKNLFNEALKRRKDLAEAYLGLGNIYLCQKKYLEAEKQYQIAINLNPLYYEAHMNLARLYQLMGEWEKRDRKIAEVCHFEQKICPSRLYIEKE